MAEEWLETAEGVIAKRLDAPYRPGERRDGEGEAHPHHSTASSSADDRARSRNVGSLILGMYDERGELRVIGPARVSRRSEKRELPAKLAPYETASAAPATPAARTAGRELEWVERAPRANGRSAFDHVSAGRIRAWREGFALERRSRRRSVGTEQLDG